MRLPLKGRARRRAVIAPLTALLLTVLVGMMAFSIDVGWVVNVKGELQNAADAASLAGAARLQGLYTQYYWPGQLNQLGVFNTATTDTTEATSPIPTAQKFAAANQAGCVSITLPTSDVSLSYYDGTTFAPPLYPTSFPNTVNVTTRRDKTANTSLGLFFAKVFNVSTLDLTATASSTIYAGDVSSLQVIPGVNAHILPVALDWNAWKTFYATGRSPDGLIHTGPNGLPQLQVYPFSTDIPGNFGLIDTGVPSNDTPAFANWIDNGDTPNDIKYLLDSQMLPVSPAAPKDWKVGPGLKSTLLSDFQEQLGKANLMPLFESDSQVTGGSTYMAAAGNGQNAVYHTVGLVGVTISQATGNGNANMTIAIQPMANVDPTAVLANVAPARPSQTLYFGSGTTATTFVSAKMTR